MTGRRPSRGERRRARREQEDVEVAEGGSCQLMSSLLWYPVGSLLAFVVVLTGTRLTPIQGSGQSRGAIVEAMRRTVQDLNGGPVSALEIALIAGVLFVIVPSLLWWLISRRPRRVLGVMFWFMHPRYVAASRRHPALGVIQTIDMIAMHTLGLWAPLPLALGLVWALPL